MLLRNGSLQLAHLHRSRLQQGMETLGLAFPPHVSWTQLEEEIAQTARRNGLEKQSRVRLQVMAGNGGLYDREGWEAERIIECFPLEEHLTRLNENGLRVGISTVAVKQPGPHASLKTCNALAYVLAAREAVSRQWNDALIPNPAGNMVETSIANIFWAEGDQLYTPPLSEGCVAGVMRAHLLQLLPGKGFRVQEAPLTPERLAQATELFCTNAIRGLRWIGNIGYKSYGQALCREIAGLL